jgi:N-acetyl-alpha-D-glucosaminyl L-malate synthase BshA
VFIHLSNFRPVKRSLDVVKIFAGVHRELPGATLQLVGEGPDLRSCRLLADELGIRESVRCLGKQEDVVRLLSQADVLLFPSEEESFGLAALEAMACEVPVVASRSGGISEVVEDGVCGYLEPVGDVEAMTRRALQLGRDPELRRIMGAAGRRITLERYTPEQIVPQYEQVYREALALAGKMVQFTG